MMQSKSTSCANRGLLFALLVLLTGALLVPVRQVYAQARPSPATSVISIDPLALALLGPLNIQYEWKTAPVNSWVLRGHFWGRNDYTGFGFGGAYRFYIADSRALTGLSAAPAADIFFFSNALGSASDVWIGGDLAYKWIFDQFAVEPILALRIGFEAGNSAYNLTEATGTVAQIGVYLGYAW